MYISAYYSTFFVGPEASNLHLTIGGYVSSKSNLSDRLSTQDSFPFSMKDRSNMNGGKLARFYTDSIQDGGSGGCWFGTCFYVTRQYYTHAEVLIRPKMFECGQCAQDWIAAKREYLSRPPTHET